MNKIFIILAFLVIFSSCKTTKNTKSQSDYVVFSLRKTECKGKCPVYFMEIYKSGKIKFEGTKNTDRIGKYEKEILEKEIESLISDFENANFFDFEEEYTASITDLPTTYISFSNGVKTKTIRDYHGSPRELKDLENKLETIAESPDNWKKIE